MARASDLNHQDEIAAEELSHALAVPDSVHHLENRDSLVVALREGAIDLASLPALTYVQATRSMPCLKLLATQAVGGDYFYSSYHLVRKDSPISTTLHSLIRAAFAPSIE